MFVAKLHVNNYRCFRDFTVEFEPGLNVLIGANNAGKSALLNCLALVFQREGRRRIVSHDFCRFIPPSEVPPSVTVTATIRSSSKDTSDDKAAIAAWITKLSSPWEAQLTYRFYLPDEYHAEFRKHLSAPITSENFFGAIDKLLPKYVSKTYGGLAENGIVADSEYLAKFDFEFIDAIRDAVSEMFTGSTSLFRSMLSQVLDAKLEDGDREKKGRLFRRIAGRLRTHIVGRLDLSSLFQLVDATGASDGGTPSVRGDLTERDILAALRLFVSKTGFDLPVTHNGLGYNNLAYIALLLASLDFKRDIEIRGPNTVLFPMLALEEPEAHLHPSLQYRLLKYIRKRLEEVGGSRQVFLTTHSTQVTSAAGLGPLICLWQNDSGEVEAAYPSRVFPDTSEGRESRSYVERYLDATKSNMLFAKGVILVEGIAEQILLPVCAEILGMPFEENHIAVVRVDGLTFVHFLSLFGVGSATAGLRSRIACLTDADPSRVTMVNGTATGAPKKCWPYQIDASDNAFAYFSVSATAAKLQTLCKVSTSVRIFPGVKTFEYDLATSNVSEFMVTGSCVHAPKLKLLCQDPPSLADELKSWLQDDETLPLTSLESIHDAMNRKAATFATCYLLAVEKAKGAHAFALERVLRTKLSDPAQQPAFVCPEYIHNAISWVCNGNRNEPNPAGN